MKYEIIRDIIVILFYDISRKGAILAGCRSWPLIKTPRSPQKEKRERNRRCKGHIQYPAHIDSHLINFEFDASTYHNIHPRLPPP
jgi:hypothetical protein